jgi:two-component system KDP operon response regulator KdpE
MQEEARARVLIVEDDDDARYALRVRLRASGYDPVTAPNALYAMRIAHRENPDVVVLDLGLPDADGIALLRELHREPGLTEVPVIVVTAKEAAACEVAAHEAGAFAFLQKPVETRELTNAIARALVFQRAGALEHGVLPPGERPEPSQSH